MPKTCRICGESCSNGIAVPNDATLIATLNSRVTPKGADEWLAGDIVHRGHFLNTSEDFRIRQTANKRYSELWFDERTGLNPADICGVRVADTDRSRRAIQRRRSIEEGALDASEATAAPSQRKRVNRMSIEEQESVKQQRLSRVSSISSSTVTRSADGGAREAAERETAATVIARLKAELAGARKEIDELRMLTVDYHYRASYITDFNLYEQELKVTKREFELLVRIVDDAATPSNFGLQSFRDFTRADYVVWWLSYVTCRAVSYNAIAATLAILSDAQLVEEQVRRKVEWVAKTLAAYMRKHHIKPRSEAQMKEDADKIFGVDPSMAEFMSKIIFLLDGTAFETYRPVSSQWQRALFCWFKSEYQWRFQAACDLTGRTVYLSKLHRGHQSDNDAMKADAREDGGGFYGMLQRRFDVEMKKKKLNREDFVHIVFGDKGYGRLVLPDGWCVILTSTAEKTDADGKPFIDPQLWQRTIFSHENIAKYRILIERVFARLTQHAKWLRGPIYASQGELAYNTATALLGLFNIAIDEGKDLFSVYTPIDELPEDTEEIGGDML